GRSRRSATGSSRPSRGRSRRSWARRERETDSGRCSTSATSSSMSSITRCAITTIWRASGSTRRGCRSRCRRKRASQPKPCTSGDLKLHILAIGRLKEDFWTAAEGEYHKRLRRYASVDIRELRDEAALLAAIPPRGKLFLLDE